MQGEDLVCSLHEANILSPPSRLETGYCGKCRGMLLPTSQLKGDISAEAYPVRNVLATYGGAEEKD